MRGRQLLELLPNLPQCCPACDAGKVEIDGWPLRNAEGTISRRWSMDDARVLGLARRRREGGIAVVGQSVYDAPK
eukprot:5572209-Prymnesium_polylepis.1